jgi:hypothetical protein
MAKISGVRNNQSAKKMAKYRGIESGNRRRRNKSATRRNGSGESISVTWLAKIMKIGVNKQKKTKRMARESGINMKA